MARHTKYQKHKNYTK